MLGVGGWLGGHLSYAQGIGVDPTTFDAAFADWATTVVGRRRARGRGRPRAMVDGTLGMLVSPRRRGPRAARSLRPSRRPAGGGRDLRGTVTCPWHATVFSLTDGSVESGPSTFPQPVDETRVTEGKIEVRTAA